MQNILGQHRKLIQSRCLIYILKSISRIAQHRARERGQYNWYCALGAKQTIKHKCVPLRRYASVLMRTSTLQSIRCPSQLNPNNSLMSAVSNCAELKASGFVGSICDAFETPVTSFPFPQVGWNRKIKTKGSRFAVAKLSQLCSNKICKTSFENRRLNQPFSFRRATLGLIGTRFFMKESFSGRRWFLLLLSPTFVCLSVFEQCVCKCVCTHT